nr:glycosyltransferase [Actinomyces slackii]
MLYSHDAQGLGHLRRNLALAHHLAQGLPSLTGAPVTGMVITGLAPGEGFDLPEGFDWLVLPGVAKGADGYEPRRLGVSRTELGLMRSSLLDAALSSFAPDLLIVDRHPYGVRQELRDPLRSLKRRHPRAKVVLGLREVLDTPDALAREWSALGSTELLRELVDHVWVYGDPAVHDLVDTGEAPTGLIDRIRFTGYLAHGRSEAEAQVEPYTTPFVLTTAGGGSDGYDLLLAAAAMKPPIGHEHVVVTGPQLSDEEFLSIAAAGGSRTLVRRTWPGMSRHVADASAVISMGGYNTICEILSTSTPALIVPREVPRLEQLIRARGLEQAGAVDLMRSQDVDSSALGAWAASMVGRQVSRAHLDLDGLAAVPRLARELLRGPRLIEGRVA